MRSARQSEQRQKGEDIGHIHPSVVVQIGRTAGRAAPFGKENEQIGGGSLSVVVKVTITIQTAEFIGSGPCPSDVSVPNKIGNQRAPGAGGVDFESIPRRGL